MAEIRTVAFLILQENLYLKKNKYFFITNAKFVLLLL